MLCMCGVAVSNTFEDCNLSKLPSDKLAMLEADCFWCVSKLLDGIQVKCVTGTPVYSLGVNVVYTTGQLYICPTRYPATNSAARGSSKESRWYELMYLTL